MEERVNCNYRIIQSLKLDATHEMVIGYNPKAPAPYVVWDCRNGNDYDTGGYTATYRQALAVLADRIRRRYDFLPTEWEQ